MQQRDSRIGPFSLYSRLLLIALVVARSAALRADTSESQRRATTTAPARFVAVTLYHDTQVRDPGGSIGLSRGDALRITVDHTINYCFTYNISTVADPPTTTRERGGIEFTKPVEFSVRHDGRTTAYKVDVVKRPTLAAGMANKCRSLADAHWTIPVDNFGWTLGVAGAFTVDKLTNPVFLLEAGTQTPPAGGTPVSGYYVRENPGARDAYDLSVAAMLHLYHSNPDTLAIWRANWVPVSFGIGIKDQSRAKYFFGTSIRFDTHLFITVGAAMGSVVRLPNDLTSGSFTPNANALANLGSRTRGAAFLAVSYTALGMGLSPFKELVTAPSPANAKPPTESQETETSNATSNAKPSITKIDPPAGKVGSDVTIMGTAFGSDQSAVKVYFSDGEKSSTATVSTVKDDSIGAAVPAGLKIGDVTVRVAVNNVESSKYTFKITD